MPDYRGHLTAAMMVVPIIFLVNYFLHFAPWDKLTLFSPIYFIASVFPDVDAPASKIRKIVEITLICTALLSLLIPGYKMLTVTALLILLSLWFVKHRGIFHKLYKKIPVMAILLSLPLLYLDRTAGILFFLGYMVHLTADGMLGDKHG